MKETGRILFLRGESWNGSRTCDWEDSIAVGSIVRYGRLVIAVITGDVSMRGPVDES